MKKLFGLLAVGVGLILTTGSTHALSCMSPLPTFEEKFEDAAIAVRGTITNVEFISNDDESQYCNDVGGDASLLGDYVFTIDVHETYKGVGTDTMTLTRTYDGINCTWGGGCQEMVEGEEYVILTEDGETLSSGLCGPCPYILAEEFTPPEETMCICTMQYDPVCGVDGNTYGNECGLNCEGVEKAYDGECIDEVISNQPEIDPTCKSWYDGCNTCTVVNGELGACTKMACFAPEPAKCLAYDYEHLNQTQVMLIKQVVTMYMGGLSPNERVMKAEMVMQKIQEKRNQINDILSRSLFPVGSEVLRDYQFVLEVLKAVETAL